MILSGGFRFHVKCFHVRLLLLWCWVYRRGRPSALYFFHPLYLLDWSESIGKVTPPDRRFMMMLQWIDRICCSSIHNTPLTRSENKYRIFSNIASFHIEDFSILYCNELIILEIFDSKIKARCKFGNEIEWNWMRYWVLFLH